MNKQILITIALLIFGGSYGMHHIQEKKEKMGTIIILNGPSGSGKSSIQREFQSLMMPNLWIKLGIDNLFDKPMPDVTLENVEKMKFWQSENPIRWVTISKDADQKNVVTLFTGEQGEKVAYGMNNAIAGYAQAGCNCIVDYIGYKKAWLSDLQNKLQHTKTFWIKIELPLDVLEERECARATSPEGHGRSHYETVYADIQYDLTLDTSKLTAFECAQKIKEFIEKQ